MNARQATPSQSARSCRGWLARGILALLTTTFVALHATNAGAQTPPAIDGNIDDMITYANAIAKANAGCGIVQSDDVGEIQTDDPKIIPCVPLDASRHYANGFGLVQYVVARPAGQNRVYLGLRTEGKIGDTDANGNPDNSGGGGCNPLDNVSDGFGIADDESYIFEFDTNCASKTIFTQNGSIVIRGNTVTGTGVLAGATGTFEFRGTTGLDLEVLAENVNLPAAYKVRVSIGSIPDGLAEDRGAPRQCQPNPGISLEKSAQPANVCVGATTRFTLTIANTGDATLSTVVSDVLPAGLTYAGNVSSTCPVGAPSVNGQTITWPAFDLAFEGTCTISFDAEVAPECIGTVVNHATVTGTVTAACFEGGSIVVSDKASFTVTCVPAPCVEVTAQGPDSACPGETATITGTARNCSTGSETVVVRVNGVQVYNNVVAAGATVQWTGTFVMPADCATGQNQNVSVTAVATGECGEATDDATVAIRCKSKPCVELTSTRSPESACPTDPITISGTVRNCSQDSETIVVTVNGAQVYNQAVPAGETRNWTTTIPMPECTAGQNVPFAIVATATGECAPAATDTDNLTVLCKSPPCVAVTANANKQNACPNEAVVVSGTVRNCGSDSATYTVTVGGVQVFTGTLAAGAEASYTREVTMGACEPNGNVTFAVVASATNTCGTRTDEESVTVRCKSVPCVELTANRTPESACPGDAVTVSGTVKNCSLDPETIVVTINGDQVFNQSVAAGATANWTKGFTMPQCTPGQPTTYTVVATATGDCPPAATDTETVSVLCKNPPCVSLIDVVANKTSACQNEAVTITGKVKNCGTESGTFVVRVADVQVFSGTLAPNAEQSFSREVSMGACKTGANVTWLVTASVENTCGKDTAEQPVSVRCSEKACVELTATGPKNACVGKDVVISGTVRNCSPIAETIIVTVDGQQAYNNSVAAGAQASWTISVPMKQCAGGQSVTYNVSASASSSCGTDTKSAVVSVLCQVAPCVTINLNAPAQACAGSTLQLCGSVTNCSAGTETIEVHLADQVKRFEDVPAGASREYCFDVQSFQCTTGDVHVWTVTAAATNNCGRSEKTATDETKCKEAMIKVKKAGESHVTDGDIIHYTIIVENPGETDLENVVLTDPLCPYTVYNDNASPTPFSEPAVGSNGTVVWHFNLARGESRAFTFQAKASLATGGASCPTSVVCSNRVTVVGSCAGSGGKNPVSDNDTVLTTIDCDGTPCPIQPCVEADASCDKSTATPGTPIVVTGSGRNCSTGPETIVITIEGQSQTFSNVPAGQTVSWTRTINMPACTGTQVIPFNVSVTGSNDCGQATAADHCSVTCSGESSAENCPRSPGFWKQQCEQKDNGSTKFTKAQVTQISERVDDVSSFFNWASGKDFELFCKNINPDDMDSRKQAKRQFAALLANRAADELNMSPDNGGELLLDLDTPFHCGNFDAGTIGELISEIDQLLGQLEGQSLSDGSVKSKYGSIIGCLDDLNNGNGIPLARSCEHCDNDDGDDGDGHHLTGDDGDCGDDDDDDGKDDDSRSDPTDNTLYRSSPNPFTASTQFTYEVTSESGANVEITVYNVAGRQMRKLALGVQASGRHTASWDGTNDSGVKVTRGVYFVRTLIEGQKTPVQRVLYVRDGQ